MIDAYIRQLYLGLKREKYLSLSFTPWIILRRDDLIIMQVVSAWGEHLHILDKQLYKQR